MSERYWGTLYLIDPNWHGNPGDNDVSVLDECRHGNSHIHVAIELWRLAGNEERASSLDKLSLSAFGRENRALSGTEIQEMLNLLEGLEQALLASVVNEYWEVPKERLAELRPRCDLVNLSDGGSQVATDGVREAMSRVVTLRTFLKEGLDRGLLLALD
jgi:hypothetical protein